MAGLMGAASRQRHTAMLPPEKFHCLLDELPLHLIPQHGFDRRLQRVDTSQPLFLNPECLVLPSGVAPPELETHLELLEGFHLQSTIAWVRDSGTGSLNPFWLGPQLDTLVSNLRSGEAVPAFFTAKQRVLLAAAGILVPADPAHHRRAEWSAIISERSQTFREKNYVPLGDLIHPFNLAALRRYYRYAIRRGAIWLGDEQSALRYVAHNEPVARYFHHQIAKAVAEIVGEPIKPSYVYLASYMSGAELKKHTDREQCEFSVTLCLDFSPEPALATPWPIHLDTSAGTVTAYQALGDGLVYRGTRVPHYRDVLPRGYTSTSLFFHYVPAEFSGPLN
ncbi:MAG: hypothetical protein WBM24_00830 [Candidatus Sulfotelmatobacter sp.]